MKHTSYQDKGFKSRKMIMAYIAMGLMTLGFVLVGIWPALHVTYAEFCAAILMATSIYSGADTITKAIGARYAVVTKPDSKAE